MRRVLLVTWPGAPRTDQVCGLLRNLGLAFDVMCADAGSGCGGEPFASLIEAARNAAFAPVRPSDLRDGRHGEVLSSLCRGMMPPGGYTAVYQCGLDLPADVLPDTRRIFDAGDGGVAAWPARAPDLLLAGDEALRQQAAGRARVSARWPFALPAPGAPPAVDGPVGWPGPMEGDLREEWRQVCDRLVAQRQALPKGLLVDAALSPDHVCSERQLDPSAYSLPAQIRALSLAVLPATDPRGHLARLFQLVGRAVPVLTTPAMAERFEGRWQLPVAEDVDGFAWWIAAWADGSQRQHLCEAAQATRAAFQQDGMAMDAFVRGLVAEVVAG